MADLLLSNIVFSESNLLKIPPRGQSMASTKTMAGCLSETVVNFAIIFENIKTLASVYNTNAQCKIVFTELNDGDHLKLWHMFKYY